jgi:hypothetical protein
MNKTTISAKPAPAYPPDMGTPPFFVSTIDCFYKFKFIHVGFPYRYEHPTIINNMNNTTINTKELPYE